ncbi:hypothetical protein CBA19CS22_34435 [Caballeronia novacaledonica]|uniref:Uncharacterized protein n=1 Tax=Caballeronia novacaledonica TaxID=1544861 RepID=A0ACB5R3I6_9BURK|nr:hypothetical protein CBA19CS22_34435 [Caballeronia novacaledonica]
MFDDQMMLCIDDGLDVVADGAGSLTTAGHGAGIRVGKRQLNWISSGARKAPEGGRSKREFAAYSTAPRKEWPADYLQSRLIVDHAVPIEVLRKILFQKETRDFYSCSGNVRDFVRSNVKHAVLTAAENQLLDASGLKSAMPLGTNWLGVNPYARYRDLIEGTEVI